MIDSHLTILTCTLCVSFDATNLDKRGGEKARTGTPTVIFGESAVVDSAFETS